MHKQIAKYLIMKKMQSYEIKIWKIRKMKKICHKSKMFKLSKKHLRGGYVITSMDSTGVGLLMNGIGRWDIDMTDEASLREVH